MDGNRRRTGQRLQYEQQSLKTSGAGWDAVLRRCINADQPEWIYSLYLGVLVRQLRVQLYGGNCQTANTVQAIPSNLWTTVSGSVTSPEGAAQATLIFSNVANSYNWNVGDTLDLDGAMLVQTPQTGLSYFDGTSPGWIWNGTPNNSTSTGPPL